MPRQIASLEEKTEDISSTLRGKGQEEGVIGRLRVIERKLSGTMPAVRK
jgi:hypothetical protein